ncbi:hypothetical protein JOC85_002459 [Bacillus mesophilus]|uniref:SGNH/GDSL hydrolase family protein n=1 Tax=Bacillus mesophilus TaxID=1808955 RepID=A0A6M0Q7K5_9BACI|nr:SGNH/GDSL hydrolase family protein [Bacillus mesophilus]MBM7661656.1 hypothetical protein [Bacillus mesophilus]NEY72322.1 SGNH/GDSL hydrolase family protein [Bacillus mesophilus]
MKTKIILVTLSITMVASIIVGNIHWKNKIESFHTVEVQKTETLSTSAEEPNIDASSDTKGSEENSEEVTTSIESNVEKQSYLGNLPEDLKKKINTAINQQKPLNFLILGSASTSEQETAWPNLVKQKLEETYGKSVFTITVKEIKDKTSKEVVGGELYMPLVESGADILLIEPFLLADNGKVRMSERLGNLTTILEAFKQKNPTVKVIIQPSNPIYDAFYYPREERDLRIYAERNNYIYLNHWGAWPKANSPELKELLTEESLPNDKGNKLWADYLINYFVSEN